LAGWGHCSALISRLFAAPRGLGAAKYCQVQATLELTTRYLQEQLCGNPVFTRPGHVRDYLAVQMRDYQREVFVVLLLRYTPPATGVSRAISRARLMLQLCIPREVVRIALQKNAAAVIVAHNHPSGNAEPSQSDIAITRQLKAALKLMDIRLLDHFIVGRGDVTSLADQGQL
jgi:DNA repair protein RadC